jgi:hypothetical protein
MKVEAARLPARRYTGARPSTAPLVLAGSALAWAALAALAVSEAGTGAHSRAGHAHGAAMSHHSAGIELPTPGWVGVWLLMVAAMMWPLALPCLDEVAGGAYRRWRPGLVATALATVTGLWLVFGLIATVLGRALSAPAGVLWWQLGWVAVAIAASRSARRSRLLWRCAKLPPIAPGGVRGVASAARAGAVSWQRCAVLCGAAMAAMSVGHAPALMVFAALSAWWEARHPLAWPDPVPAVLLAVGAAALALSAVVAG